MPKAMEAMLKKKALKKYGTTKSKAARAYIYGAMRATGWVPKRERD